MDTYVWVCTEGTEYSEVYETSIASSFEKALEICKKLSGQKLNWTRTNMVRDNIPEQHLAKCKRSGTLFVIEKHKVL